MKQITGADGRYGYTTPAGSTEIRAKLRGPWFIVNNQSGPGLEAAQTGPAVPPINLNLGAGGDDQLAQDFAFYWANFARELAHTILGPADLPNLPVLTNINQTCNAFWNGSSINFFKAGNGCPNTAYSDVVMHEYGHGIDAVKGGIVNGGYSEGFGDAMAVLATRQPCVGRDFFGAGTCLRSASDVVLWPSPGDVHTIGRPYGGFTWELVQQLKQTFSEDEAYAIATRLVLGAAAANPSDIADAVRLSFIVDDNDGNLANGTPAFPGDRHRRGFTKNSAAARSRGRRTLGQRRRLVPLDAGEGRAATPTSCRQAFTSISPARCISRQTPAPAVPLRSSSRPGSTTQHQSTSCGLIYSAASVCQRRTNGLRSAPCLQSICRQVTIRSTGR